MVARARAGPVEPGQASTANGRQARAVCPMPRGLTAGPGTSGFLSKRGQATS